ncbi:MAG: amino acid permease [Gemmatimonadetes bacterium]|nr:amino acid permease [Gemmatimonadota bacterium]
MADRPKNGQNARTPPGQSEVIPGREGGLGMFGGVFTPSILTILGVIMYLRFGWVVGQVGLGGTLVIVTLATSITLLTALSVAAIATDQRVRTGGAYYMISRSLGIETGGAVGIPLYLAQGLSVALYTVGFAESVTGVFPSLNARLVGIVTTLAVAALAIISARAAIRAQYVIMAVVALSLLSLVFGSGMEGVEPQGLGPSTLVEPESFWVVFAVFFPAVTGIMAGVNMSGDLADPGRAIPKGTFLAIGVGYVIYMTLPVLLAMRVDTQTLVSDPLVMRRISLWGNAILLGVWGAALSSAVGSILGAPRVLQAMARDGILPRWLSWLRKGSGEDDSPRFGTALTLGIALVAVWFGDLNMIAPILTMFFLTTYGVLNVAAGIERFLGSPSFRPRLSVHWIFSLAGAAGCASVMFLINPAATVAAGLFVLGVFVWLERRGMQAAWGDVRQGILMMITRAGLLRLGRLSLDPRNWRPHFLVLSGAPTRRWHLIELAADFSHHNKGLLSIATILRDTSVTHDRKRAMERKVQDYLGKRGIHGFVRVISAGDPFAGAEQLVEAYGLGPLVPNTILLGDSEESQHRPRYCAMIERFWQSKRNVVIVRDADRVGFGDRKRIDIWWGGLQGNGALLMILGYLLKTSLAWREVDIRLKMVIPSEAAAEDARRNLTDMLEQTRTGLQTEVLVSGERSAFDLLHDSSRGADLIIMGMAAPDQGDFAAYYEQLRNRTSGLPCTVFALAAEDVAFREVLFRREDQR